MSRVSRALALIVILMVGAKRRAVGQAPLTLSRAELSHRLGVQLDTVRQVTHGATALVSPAVTQVTVAPGTFFAAKVGKTAARIQPTTMAASGHSPASSPEAPHYKLPYQLYGMGTNGTGIHFAVRYEVAGDALTYDPTTGAFNGDLLVGLEDVDQPAAAEPLLASVELQLSGVHDVQPRELRLTHTNIPYETVHVVATTSDNLVTLRIVPSFDPAGIGVPVPVRQPLFRASLSPRRIDGYGLEAATLTLLGAPSISKDSLPVSVSTSRGAVGGTVLEVPANRAATTAIRSHGLGVDTVTLSSNQAAMTVLSLTYVTPWAFFIAALLGGLSGAVVNQLQTKKKKKASLPRYLVGGVLSGLAGAAGWALGVNVLDAGITVPNGSEAGAFFVAYLVGHAGLRQLAKLTPVAGWLTGGNPG